MNTKGLSLDKVLIRKIYDSIDTIALQNLRGINVFNSFSWIGFSKEEFKNLLSLFVYLDDSGFFKNINNNHHFIFNYSTDITEMDIAVVLEDKKDIFFIDIETKNGEDESELISKITNQIEKRKNEYLPQLLKEKSFVTVGYVNNKFVCGYIVKESNVVPITDESLFYGLITTMNGYNNQNEYLEQSSNLASIVKLCSDIQHGVYNFYEDTNRIYGSLISKIGEKDVCVVYGNAGTGKSVLALKLFFENRDSKILLMNSKLYYALNLNHGYYYNDKATFNSKRFAEIIDKNTISIIDECQRLPLEDIVEIINKSKITFLFGDQKQACFNKCTLQNAKQLEKTFKNDYGFSVYSRVLKKSRRYKDEVSDALEFLTSPSLSKPNNVLPIDYQIDIFYDEKLFLEKYDITKGIKKIYAPLCCASKTIKISDRVLTKADYTDDEFSIWLDSKDYYGTTYHALSFDIDHCFVYLDSTKVIKFNKNQYIYHTNHNQELEYNDLLIFMNELNVLFTRGRKSLNILAKDIETYLYLNSLINKLK